MPSSIEKTKQSICQLKLICHKLHIEDWVMSMTIFRKGVKKCATEGTLGCLSLKTLPRLLEERLEGVCLLNKICQAFPVRGQIPANTPYQGQLSIRGERFTKLVKTEKKFANYSKLIGVGHGGYDKW